MGGAGDVVASVGPDVTPPPSQSTLDGQSQQLQDGLKRRPGLQFKMVGTPLWHWMKVAQFGSLGFGTAPDNPPAQGVIVGPGEY